MVKGVRFITNLPRLINYPTTLAPQLLHLLLLMWVGLVVHLLQLGNGGVGIVLCATQ